MKPRIEEKTVGTTRGKTKGGFGSGGKGFVHTTSETREFAKHVYREHNFGQTKLRMRKLKCGEQLEMGRDVEQNPAEGIGTGPQENGCVGMWRCDECSRQGGVVHNV